MSICMFEHKSKCLFVCSNTHNFYNNQLIEATPTLLPPFWLNTGLALGSKMKEIRIENGSMYFERLIQVTKNPKGEQRPTKAALKRVNSKSSVLGLSNYISFVSFFSWEVGQNCKMVRGIISWPVCFFHHCRPFSAARFTLQSLTTCHFTASWPKKSYCTFLESPE